MTRIFYLYPGPDGFVRGWGQADAETDADIAAILAIPGRVQVDAEVIAQYKAGGTWGWQGGALVAMALPVDIERERAAALWAADQAAEAARRPFLSAGAGQAIEYMLTLEEARACQAAASPVASDYPLLVAELDALAAVGQTVTIAAVAASIIATDHANRVRLAAIKMTRRVRKIGIRAATTADGIAAALALTPQ
jgi:hypothetical protein